MNSLSREAREKADRLGEMPMVQGLLRDLADALEAKDVLLSEASQYLSYYDPDALDLRERIRSALEPTAKEG